ncbi:MAG: hypothetical protein JWN37_859 [Candidatus Nomurabacteria bacterium]|nr:hypothetical protein [Candidatus Nomurabacteria bacterium]
MRWLFALFILAVGAFYFTQVYGDKTRDIPMFGGRVIVQPSKDGWDEKAAAYTVHFKAPGTYNVTVSEIENVGSYKRTREIYRSTLVVTRDPATQTHVFSAIKRDAIGIIMITSPGDHPETLQYDFHKRETTFLTYAGWLG